MFTSDKSCKKPAAQPKFAFLVGRNTILSID